MRYFKAFLFLMVAAATVFLEITLAAPGEQKCIWLGLAIAGGITVGIMEIAGPMSTSGVAYGDDTEHYPVLPPNSEAR